MRKVQHYALALWKAPVGPAVTALLGLILTAVFLFVFASDLSLIFEDDINGMIVSFVLCGLGAGLGFILMRNLFPRRQPISLFDGPVNLSVQPATQEEVRAETIESLPGGIKNARPVHSNVQITPVMKSHVRESIATHKTHDGGGVAAFATVAGMTAILVGRLAFAWQFLSLAILAGSAIALVLYWRSNRQDPNIFGGRVPVAGGIIGAAAVAGVGIVMLRFHFLRDFLLLAAGAGCAVALILSRGRRRRQNSRISLV